MTETVKRRIVWMTDSEWGHVLERSKRAGVNPSNLFRQFMGNDPVRLDRFGTPHPAPKRKR